MCDMNLDTLLLRCREGNELAWESFVRAYQGRIFRLTVTYTRNRDEARDLAQEIFLVIYRKLHSFRDTGTGQAWIMKLARNRCVDYLRSKKRRPPAHDVPVDRSFELASDALNPEEELVAETRRRLLQRAINSLSTLSREIILLKDMQGMAFHEIASTLDIPLGTAKSRSNRARRELAQAVLAFSGTGNSA
jgi:RNA polymerase sigma-70 factor, ECF subfamily